MNYPSSDKSGEGREDQSVDRKEYVKPVIEEGVNLPTATAQGVTPAIIQTDD